MKLRCDSRFFQLINFFENHFQKKFLFSDQNTFDVEGVYMHCQSLVYPGTNPTPGTKSNFEKKKPLWDRTIGPSSPHRTYTPPTTVPLNTICCHPWNFNHSNNFRPPGCRQAYWALRCQTMTRQKLFLLLSRHQRTMT